MIRRIVKFSAWQGLAQVVSAGTMFLLAAVVSDEGLREYGLALSVASIFASVATLRGEQAIPIAPRGWLRKGLVSFAILSALAAAMCAVIVLALFFSLEAAVIAGLAIGASMAVVQVEQQLLIADGRSGSAGRRAALRAGVLSLGVLVPAFAGSPWEWVIASAGLSAMAVVVIVVLEVYRYASSSRKEIVAAAIEYRDTWSPYIGQTVLSSISLNATYLAVYLFADPGSAAALLLADRIVRVPISLLSASIRSHLTHEFSERFRSGEQGVVRSISARWAMRILFVALPLLLLLGVAVALVGGASAELKVYGHAGYFVIALSLWGSAVLANPPSMAVLTAARKSRYVFYLQAMEFLLKILIACAYLVNTRGEPEPLILVFLMSISGILYNAATFATSRWALRQSLHL